MGFFLVLEDHSCHWKLFLKLLQNIYLAEKIISVYTNPLYINWVEKNHSITIKKLIWNIARKLLENSHRLPTRRTLGLKCCHTLLFHVSQKILNWCAISVRSEITLNSASKLNSTKLAEYISPLGRVVINFDNLIRPWLNNRALSVNLFSFVLFWPWSHSLYWVMHWVSGFKIYSVDTMNEVGQNSKVKVATYEKRDQMVKRNKKREHLSNRRWETDDSC